MDNGVGLSTPVLKLMTEIIDPSLVLIIFVYIMDLDILLSSVFVNKVVELIDFYVATYWCIKGKNDRVNRGLNEEDFDQKHLQLNVCYLSINGKIIVNSNRVLLLF